MLKEFAIVSDFDGTITQEDSNDLLFKKYGNDVNVKIEEDFCAGILGTRPAMAMHFESLHITMEEYYKFLEQHIHIDEGFDPLLNWIHEKNIPLFIVSAGFRQGIEHVLGQKRLENIQVFANDLYINEESSSDQNGQPIYPVFAESTASCIKDFGPCGNCKRACIQNSGHQTRRQIVFVGDGLTDRCAAEEADLVFAKTDSALAKYCSTHNLPYKPFDGFKDVLTDLKNLKE
ncbi:MAG: MtnX-like HAD-IB family phosphatase [Defluviitaleaceae bacterium]|nr:MtnX-like HAD-IB family phosphatase [Defluviitaleaceae bacterium]